MLTVKRFERTAGTNGTQLTVHSDEFMGGEVPEIRYLLIDGVLETYMDAYGYAPDVCLAVMLLDAFYDDVEAPHSGDAGAPEKFLAIAAMAAKRIVFKCDRKALLAAVTIADEAAAAAPRGSWAASHATRVEAAAGHRRRREEMLGDSFVTAMMDDKKAGKSGREMSLPVDSVVTRKSTFRVEW